MNLSQIKKIYKSLPPSLTLPLRLLPFDIIGGSSYRLQSKELREYNSSNNFYRQSLFEKKIVNYLNEAIVYTRFYRDYAKSKNINKISDASQLFEFPIIDKEQVTNDISWFFDERHSKSSYNVSTGGTTGKQTTLRMSNQAYGREWAFVNDFLSSRGVSINEKRLCLRGVDGIGFSELIGFNNLYKELLISPFKLNKDTLVKNIDNISKFNAKWIHGYPSSVSEFAKHLLELGLSIDSIKHVLLVSEALYPEQQKIIDKAFNAEILTFYGMTERVIFAPRYGEYFIPSKLYGATELIDGVLVGTGFINDATKLIRYNTGDSASAIIDSMGFVEKIISLDGRWGKEYLLGENGTKISMTALNVHSDVLDKVSRYQFYQTVMGKCDLLIIENSKLSAQEQLRLLNAFQNKVGDVLKINIRIVRDIPLTSRGKHQFINSII
ncbi:hypothetical protein F2K80_003205 [Vibrio fluvialis]|nr:hypothetical protein [Vibrio fluvialis]